VSLHTGSSGTRTIDTQYSYAWWDEAKQSGVMVKGDNPSNPNNYLWAAGTSKLVYDVNGHLQQATINDGSSAALSNRVITYTSDAYGQVLIREEKTGTTLGPRQLYYYLDGHRIGDVGCDGP